MGYAVRSHWSSITCSGPCVKCSVACLKQQSITCSDNSNPTFFCTRITSCSRLNTVTHHKSISSYSPAAIMDPEVIPNFLADQRDNASADSQHYFITFEDYWERKLWHELTNTLVEFFNQPGSASQRLPIYNTFIKTFADKINQLKLVELGLRAATQCQSGYL